jgi:hypothetical protein
MNVNSIIFKDKIFKECYYRIPSNNYHGDLLICKTGNQGKIYDELKKINNPYLNWIVLSEISFNNKSIWATESGKSYKVPFSAIDDIAVLKL